MFVMRDSHIRLLLKSLQFVTRNDHVKPDLKMVDKHSTGDVGEARTDEIRSDEMKLYQFPCVIFQAVRR